MPGLSLKADEMSRPEATPEEIGKIHNGVSMNLDDDIQIEGHETDQDTNTDCDTVTENQLAPGGDMLEQIFAIEAKISTTKQE